MPELTRADLAAHAVAIAHAETKDQFVTTFGAYVKDVVTREEDPYEKVALFVHGMIAMQRDLIAELMAELMAKYGGGSA